MPLTHKQKTVAVIQAKNARNGDAKAVQFFENMRASNPALHKEYMDAIAGKDDNAVGIKRDMIKADTKILTNKQFKVACEQAVAAKAGEDGAIRFFATQEDIANKTGGQMAKTYVAIRDEVFARNDFTLLGQKEAQPAGKVEPQTEFNRP
jgi:hypothetical protein